MKDFEGSQNGLGTLIFEWLHQDCIAVMVIHNHNIVIASAGWAGNLPVWSM